MNCSPVQVYIGVMIRPICKRYLFYPLDTQYGVITEYGLTDYQYSIKQSNRAILNESSVASKHVRYSGVFVLPNGVKIAPSEREGRSNVLQVGLIKCSIWE
jgi:hypothetical protein